MIIPIAIDADNMEFKGHYHDISISLVIGIGIIVNGPLSWMPPLPFLATSRALPAVGTLRSAMVARMKLTAMLISITNQFDGNLVAAACRWCTWRDCDWSAASDKRLGWCLDNVLKWIWWCRFVRLSCHQGGSAELQLPLCWSPPSSVDVLEWMTKIIMITSVPLAAFVAVIRCGPWTTIIRDKGTGSREFCTLFSVWSAGDRKLE